MDLIGLQQIKKQNRMKAKEKAEDLFMMYVNKGMSQIKPVINRVIRKEMAKQCALIAVNEIMLAIPDASDDDSPYNHELKYWQQVKQEIETFKSE
jgi:hypothetical protein